MAEHCASTARKLNVPHITTAIPWSNPPFPPSPTSGAKLELTARQSRYHLILDAMQTNGANTIAFGHHADDQVETLLMRMARGGSTGMRHVRRWGMGFGDGPGSLGWAGLNGMSKWIIRPLLAFGKDRILATCSHNRLDYVTDSTNFQPALTLRNAVRHWLTLQDDTEMPTLPKILQSELNQVKRTLISSGLRHSAKDPGVLREDVEKIINNSEEVESCVTTVLQCAKRTSPPSTLLLSIDQLPRNMDSDAQSRLVLRVLRLVSPYPWGSPRAEAHRNSRNLQQAAGRLWDQHTRPSPFTVGGGVLWTPVTVLSDGTHRLRLPRPDNSEQMGWLASRLPPLAKNQHPSVTVQGLDKDITEELLQAIDGTSSTYEILWDCRFRVVFCLRKTRELIETFGKGTRIIITSEGKWFLPQLAIHSEAGQERYSLSVRNIDNTKNTIAQATFIRPLTEL